jgi:hypothetical protein
MHPAKYSQVFTEIHRFLSIDAVIDTKFPDQHKQINVIIMV